MKIYKLKHIPTGLYFQPSRTNGNFSTNGKIYQSKPNIDWALTVRIRGRESSKCIKILNLFFKLTFTYGRCDQHFNTNNNDWEIIEIN